MPQPKQTDDTAQAAAYASAQFDLAFSLREQKEALFEAVKANREDLRRMSAMGTLDAEQSELLEELYPLRVKQTPEERAQREADEAEATAARMLEKAQKAAEKAQAARAAAGVAGSADEAFTEAA